MREDAEGGRRGKSEVSRGEGGAQTFRRGRALHFLERLELRRRTLAVQLEENVLEAIHPVIAGELKAVDAIMQEFIQVFELHEGSSCSGRGHGRSRRHEAHESEETAHGEAAAENTHNFSSLDPVESPTPAEHGERS